MDYVLPLIIDLLIVNRHMSDYATWPCNLFLCVAKISHGHDNQIFLYVGVIVLTTMEMLDILHAALIALNLGHKTFPLVRHVFGNMHMGLSP
jgi:hypothetical protein